MRWRNLLLLAGVLVLAYFLLWPVPVAPVAWQAPANPGYGDGAAGSPLAQLERIPLPAGEHGMEDLALGPDGAIYGGTESGAVLRLDPASGEIREWRRFPGRPLGLTFDRDGTLWLADAFRGLVRVAADGSAELVATAAEGTDFGFTNNVDVAPDGRVYFSDASSKFAAREWGGTYASSKLDILEHGGHGRLLRFDPKSGETEVLLRGLQFANGVAVAADGRFVLVAETGSYSIRRLWLEGPKAGTDEPFAGPFPGFPDNLTRGPAGRFWVALVSPRNRLLDALSGSPGSRRAIWRLPAFLRPEATVYGHVIALDDAGRPLLDLQDPAGALAVNTAVLETATDLWVASLQEPAIGRLPKAGLGLPEPALPPSGEAQELFEPRAGDPGPKA
ncbi:MAG: SMP-30/gluconolactonase/LRE family protein [Acidobacteriota bacterium]